MTKKVVFITGASRGIGLATAQKFSQNGWYIAAFYNQKPGPDIKNCFWYQLELSDSESIKFAFAKAIKDLEQIDCLVNNAGIFGHQKFPDYDESIMDKLIAINEKGTYLCTKEAIKNLKKGSIVNLSSTAGQVGSSDPIYAATKAAILGFTKSLAKALAPNIRVNAVAPGVTQTDMMKNYDPQRKSQLIDLTLLKKIADPKDIASGIYFLASDESSHITGICLDVNGGYVLR